MKAGTSWMAGIEPDGATHLRGLLDEAAASLDACGLRIQRLLDGAGTTCRAPIDIREASRLCVGTADELSRRLAVIQGGVADIRSLGEVPIRGPVFDVGPTVTGCGTAPAPVLVMSCNPLQLRTEIFGRPPAPLGPGLRPPS